MTGELARFIRFLKQLREHLVVILFLVQHGDLHHVYMQAGQSQAVCQKLALTKTPSLSLSLSLSFFVSGPLLDLVALVVWAGKDG